MTVSAVTEPETYAMLLIGLGLVSFSLRSKKG
ncbi:MAG: PEP-CTERM sorting domain-containing protein [Nitrosomonadaceae bacterium]|nr:PEP-CTERM sorting domain-containing protein [Nitrosomonadaceae bacterium]